MTTAHKKERRAYLSLNGKRCISRLADFRARNDLPYGKWTTADGREILFNRFYEPMYQRRQGGTAERADSKETVPFAAEEWFYNDGTKTSERRKVGLQALADWGLKETELVGD